MKHALIFGLLCAAGTMQAMNGAGRRPGHTVVDLRERETGEQTARKESARQDNRAILPVPGTIHDEALERSETEVKRLLYAGAGLCLILSALNWFGIH